MAKSLKIPKKNKAKPWSWVSICLIAFGLCLVGSFLIPDNFFSNLFEGKISAKKDRSSKTKKNLLSMDLNKTIERSAKAIKAKDFDRAAKLATRIVKEHPDSWIGWLNLGIAKRFGEGVSGVKPAIVALQNAAKLNPDMAEIQIYLASALACTEHVKAARAVAFKALSMSPNSIEALTTAVKVTNFSTQNEHQIDSGAAPLLDKIKSLLQLHELSTDEDNDVNRLSPSQEAMLRFALFKAYDENEEYSKSAVQLMSANNVKQFLNQQLLAMQGTEVGSWGKESSSALLGELLAAFDGGDSGVVEYPLSMKLGLKLDTETNSAQEKEKYVEDDSGAKAVSSSSSDLSVESHDSKPSIIQHNGDQYCKSLLKSMVAQKIKNENEGNDNDDEGKSSKDSKNEDNLIYARPLVLVGMPRSGATLLQQMLAGHDNILEGDEYNYFSASIQMAIDEVMQEMKTAKLSMSEQVSVLSQHEEALKSLHAKYLALLQSDVSTELQYVKQRKESEKQQNNDSLFSRFFTPSTTKNNDARKHDLKARERKEGGEGGTPNGSVELDSAYYVVDKQLANTWWAGALPPCAKVILLKRDPMDLAFSNFKTNFPMGGFEFTNNQTELGWRVALTERLLELWEKVIPAENLHVVSYHALVEQPEATTRLILSYLGLSYNESVTKPHEYGGVITSPSSVSLRNPIEMQKFHSIKKWEKYASLMEEFIYAYKDAKKWIRYVMDGEGVREGLDSSRQGWLERGAYFDEQLTAKANVAAILNAAADGATSDELSRSENSDAEVQDEEENLPLIDEL